MVKILLIEDDDSQREALEEFISETLGYKVLPASNVSDAVNIYRKNGIHIIVSDLMLPDGTGIDLIKEVRETDQITPILILTAQPTIESAVDAIHSGASDYLTKPVDLSLLKNKISRFVEHINLREENIHLRQRISHVYGPGNLIGNSPLFMDVVKKARQIAETDVTVLIEGESGTGKEMIANLLHESSRRSKKPFIRVNCGALTKSILESELFGVVKGAYTGADKDRMGYFEASAGGTIFLDEIGELDLESQVRLLRVIEERKVTRLGSTAPIDVDVRIITATNRSLLEEVEENKFREDLYYRLAVIRLELPPLRLRKDDIPLLFNHFVTQFNEKYGKSVTKMSPDLLKYFQTYDWPGNIRQFRNVLEGMVVLADDDILQKSELPAGMDAAPRKGSSERLRDTILPGISLENYEKAIIRKNLEHTGGNREKTAKILEISERTLYRKIKDFGM